MQPVLERRDDAEIGTGAAQAPEQIGVFAGTGGNYRRRIASFAPPVRPLSRDLGRRLMAAGAEGLSPMITAR
jgi:hypothetical protein